MWWDPDPAIQKGYKVDRQSIGLAHCVLWKTVHFSCAFEDPLQSWTEYRWKYPSSQSSGWPDRTRGGWTPRPVTSGMSSLFVEAHCVIFCVCHDVNNIWKHCFTISDLSHSPQICTTKCWSLVLTLWIAYGSAPSRCWCTFLLRLSSGGAPGLWSTPPSTPGTWRCMLTERAGSVPSSFPFPASRDPLTVGFLLENIITKRTLFESVYSQRSPRSAKEIF